MLCYLVFVNTSEHERYSRELVAMAIVWCGRSNKPLRPNAVPGDPRNLIIPDTRRIAPVLWGGNGLLAFQQFVGINIIFYFG